MQSIFEYIDYQEYLRHFYAEKKAENPHFSYRFMAQKLHLDAGFIAKVLQGKMQLALSSVIHVAQLCKLNTRESEYLDAMVRFCKAKDKKEVKIYFDKMMQLKGIHSSITEEKQYQFYTKWYYTAVRSLLGIYSFKGDYQQLGQMLSPPISAEEAQDAVELLLELGFVAQDPSGNYILTESHISTGGTWRTDAIREFQRETLALAKEAIDRHPKEVRDISTITVAVSHKDLEAIRLKAQEFRQSILQLKTGNEIQDIVYQINIQVLPLTQQVNKS